MRGLIGLLCAIASYNLNADGPKLICTPASLTIYSASPDLPPMSVLNEPRLLVSYRAKECQEFASEQGILSRETPSPSCTA